MSYHVILLSWLSSDISLLPNTVALYLHFATSVIHEITTALGIYCFRWEYGIAFQYIILHFYRLPTRFKIFLRLIHSKLWYFCSLFDLDKISPFHLIFIPSHWGVPTLLVILTLSSLLNYRITRKEAWVLLVLTFGYGLCPFISSFYL